MKLKLVPAGEFTMGSTENEITGVVRSSPGTRRSWFEDETPQHKVILTKPFYMGIHEVTVGQYRQFVKDTGHKTAADFRDWVGWDPNLGQFVRSPRFNWENPGFPQTDKHPVVNVTWHDAVAFCEWLSKKEGQTYRLPTEAEWEYSCRGGTKTSYSCGDDPDGLARAGNVADTSLQQEIPAMRQAIRAADGWAFTAPVGSFAANGFGLYDMHGNVWEYCEDRYDASYYAKSPEKDPPASPLGYYRVTRGGSWMSPPGACRAARRERIEPDVARDIGGFRIVME